MAEMDASDAETSDAEIDRSDEEVGGFHFKITSSNIQ